MTAAFDIPELEGLESTVESNDVDPVNSEVSDLFKDYIKTHERGFLIRCNW
jgi:hypothetical protein